ncbi:PD-(D/E)XK nuclease family protein [Zeaxanthinibacter sp. PT1]|uniref:PD-(D/E)XK nuclease family protein n=1 Tax=Zeaxanthinibacter TaxID=561554 RepID=UPI0023499D77|nr:PD-(D/E)XK nuclease family protein [Zeaxanthinibacter sp. PT1]MDC6350719.1 PD-(D/E)XK nuclease family protein [Zeaxanthinibacter sp. PT1]
MIPVDTYYSVKRVSSSSLKYIDPEEGGSPQKFKSFLDGTLKEDKKSYLINGTLIHMSILEPHKFVIANVTKPSATLGEIADNMVQNEVELTDENILAAIEAFGFQNNWKPGTKVKKFKTEGGIEYVRYMQNIKNTGKIGMSESTGKIVDACKTSLLMDPQCYFWLKEIEDEEDIEAVNEKEVFWEMKVAGVTLKFKAKIDRLIINHKFKTYFLLDVKTTGQPISEFPIKFENFKYPRQMRFYKKAAAELMKQLGYGEYLLESAFIAAVETSNYHTAQLFDVTAYLEEKDQEIPSLLKRIAFHTSSANWVDSVEKCTGDGIIRLSPKK